MSAVWSEEAGPVDASLIALIHGTMDRSTGMLKVSRRLDDRFRVLRYDRRGYGRSRPPDGSHPGPFGMTAQVDDLVELLDGRPAILVGHSYGGNVALATAERCPDQIGGVALYEVPLSWESWWPGTTAGAAAQATAGTPGDAAERFMRRLVGDDTWERLPERTRSIRRAEGPAMVGELRDLASVPPWRPDAIHCPIVLAYGSNGQAHHSCGMQHLHEIFPDSQLHILGGCRHDAPSSHPAMFSEVVVEAAARLAGPPWADVVSRSTTAP